MKPKIINLLLVLTSLFGYLEWGVNNSTFLYQAEIEIISKIFISPKSIVHPFTILPLVGQIILVITVFQNNPNKILTFIGLIGLFILLFFMFLIGLISFNYKILLSTLPFLLVCFYTFFNHKIYKK